MGPVVMVNGSNSAALPQDDWLISCIGSGLLNDLSALFVFREFVGYIPRYKTFFGALPEMLCEGEMGLEFTCWNGDDVVER